MANSFKKIGVLGCGLMGSGIAQVAATKGFEVTVLEKSEERLDRGMKGIDKSLSKLVEKGKLPAADREAILKRLHPTLKLGDFGSAEFIIEAISEDLEEKKRLWRELDGICAKEVIFASNTSSLTIMAMATVTKRSDKFVGMHFFNPVPVMKLVEIVRTLTTSDATFQTAIELGKTLGKTPVTCKDRSGFIVNLLLIPYLMDGIRALEQSVASIADIDQAMMLGCAHPMGPLALADFVGLDTLCSIGEIMFHEYRDPKYAPPGLLRKIVQAGFLGKKSGQGFYDYRGPEPAASKLSF